MASKRMLSMEVTEVEATWEEKWFPAEAVVLQSNSHRRGKSAH